MGSPLWLDPSVSLYAERKYGNEGAVIAMELLTFRSRIAADLPVADIYTEPRAAVDLAIGSAGAEHDVSSWCESLTLTREQEGTSGELLQCHDGGDEKRCDDGRVHHLDFDYSELRICRDNLYGLK